MRTPRTKTLAVGLLAAATLAAAGPIQSALAFISPPLVLVAGTQGTGTVVAKGAAVDVPITYTCAGPSSMDVQLQLTEAVGRRTAFGYAYANVPCSGQTISTTLRVQAQPGSATFGIGKGAASLNVFGFYCTTRTCYSGQDTFNSTIKIAK